MNVMRDVLWSRIMCIEQFLSNIYLVAVNECVIRKVHDLYPDLIQNNKIYGNLLRSFSRSENPIE